MYRRSNLALVKVAIPATVFSAFVVLVAVAMIVAGNWAALVIPVVLGCLVVGAILWYLNLTPSSIELHADGRVVFCARWRRVEVAAAEIEAVRMSALNFKTRMRIQSVGGGALWVLNSDFPDFYDFISLLLTLNPMIVPVGVPGVYPSGSRGGFR